MVGTGGTASKAIDVDAMRRVYGGFNAALDDPALDGTSPLRVKSGVDYDGVLIETGARRGDGGSGAGYWEVVRASEDFLICAANDYYDQQFRFDIQPEMDMVSIRFIYAGELGLRASGQDDLVVPTRSASALALPGERAYELMIRERQRLLSVTVHLRAERLWDEVGMEPGEAPALLRDLFAGNGDGRHQAAVPMTPGMNHGVMDILASQLSGGLRQRYLAIKSQELLCLFMESAQRVAGVAPLAVTLRQQDRARLYEARAILLDQFTNPPTVDMLARLVGINRTTLRSGFKEMFGETIADFCHNRRMTLARQLLKDPRFTIGEIAAATGYNQPTNFSAAFRRHFGALPRDFRTN